MSELARVSSRERSLTEDCGLALLKTQALHVQILSFYNIYTDLSFIIIILLVELCIRVFVRLFFFNILQIEECSLKSQLIQQTPKEESSSKLNSEALK